MVLKMSIAEMRTRITLQTPTVNLGSGGAQRATYANATTTPTVWAKWVNAHGDEAISGDAEKSAQRATVTIRARSDVKATWQILKDSEAWRVLSVDEVYDGNRWTVMIVEQIKGTVN